LDKVLRERFADLDADVEHHPVLLVPDCPKEGIKIADFVKTRYGISNPESMFAQAEEAAKQSGLSLNLSHKPFLYPTVGAHCLIRMARPLGTQHALAVAISSAYFVEARNVADSKVLAEIATRHGFDFETARQILRRL
jgi:predicted DsbA family dithiol-disulfide isomerase